ncbi:MAG: MBL fold metallo-hydrolase [Candidatus Accumulibacter sp.]|jgi:glyoxylase-like metal-dependent hydrolase (beta-lactamase superfamily II)|nr:MBL fold metallo-hydrolase [Accumulibacter sp.]
MNPRLAGVRLLSLFAVCLSFAASSSAAPPAPAGTQVPGFFRTVVGNLEVVGSLEVTALYDGQTEVPQRLLHGLDARAVQTLLREAFVSADRPMQTAVNAYIVHTGQNLVLVDTGAAACFGPALGNVRRNLEAAGYRPEDIDTVLLTHLHADHACGLTDKAGTAVFPNATVWASRNEAAFWLNEETAAQAPDGKRQAFDLARAAVAPYVASGRFKTYAAGDVLLPGLVVEPSPGHTPGHTGYLFASHLLVWGDIVHSHAVQFAHPEVSIEFDSDRKKAIATRKQVFADAARRRLLVAGAHLPFPGIGHVRAGKGGYRWVPVEFGQNFPSLRPDGLRLTP